VHLDALPVTNSSTPQDTPGLLARIDRGDLSAIDPLVNRHHDRILALADELRHRYGLSEAEYGPEDIVSDALLALWEQAAARKLAPFRTREEYWRWIRASLRGKVRQVRDRLRRKKRGGSGIARPAGPPYPARDQARGPGIPGLRIRPLLDELDEQLPPVPPMERWVDDRDEFLSILEHLRGPMVREVLLLTYEGHTADEISRRLGIATRTVRRKLVLIRLTLEELGFGN
jgi:RNA polymerase sigma factor (sigma-70 family)